MTDIPDIHRCAQLVYENEQFCRKLRKVKRENADLQQMLANIREREKTEALLKQYVTTRNMEVQTDPVKATFAGLHQRPSGKASDTNAKVQAGDQRVNKVLSMHNNLMRRYEKELKMNMQHVETITELNLKINEVEQRLKETQIRLHEVEHLSQKRKPKRRSSHSRGRRSSASSNDSADLTGLLEELKCVRKERDKLKADNKQLKSEMTGLDRGFFDEVEDIKFALQQSARLNKEYEKSLRKVCSQFGLPYPHPEKQMT